MVSYILAVFCGVLILVADQFTKYYIISNFTLGQSAEFINGFIDITYIHNRGGAWGMLSGYRAVLLIITAAVMAVCVIMLVKFGRKSKLFFWAVMLVLAGGVGNLIDRVFRGGNVIDFLHFEFIPDFPVFNIADCGIVIGAGLLILYFLIDMIKETKSKKPQPAGEPNDENV